MKFDFWDDAIIMQNDVALGYERDRRLQDVYLIIDMYLPKSFFKLERTPTDIFSISNRSIPDHLKNLVPEQVNLNLEMFAAGEVDGTNVFYFKPWVTNIKNDDILPYIENFIMVAPRRIILSLIGNALFLDEFEREQIKRFRVLEDLSDLNFNHFGLWDANVPKRVDTEQLQLERLPTINNYQAIKDFYRRADATLNTATNSIWFAIKRGEDTVGYIQLYTTVNRYVYGFFAEGIIAKQYRRKGIMSYALRLLYHMLSKNSYAKYLRIEVDPEDIASTNLLKKFGFTKDYDEYELDLGGIEGALIKDAYTKQNKLLIYNKYVDKFSNYLSGVKRQ